jgi:imidazole glycerol-phosphate synthase subunit HisH
VIVVVDYGSGNVRSVVNALAAAGADARVSGRVDDLRAAERIVLPGVGAFAECMRNLLATGLVGSLEDEVRVKRKPFLGICVGMQLLAREGHENGVHAGLGWLPGVVSRFTVEDKGLKVPHVGWNEVVPTRPSVLLRGVKDRATFYFVHSYHFTCDDEVAVTGVCGYGAPFTAAVEAGNLFGTQFHPEKSQDNGQRVLANFLAWNG